MATLRNAIKTVWLGKRYAVIEGKENEGYADTPMTKRTRGAPLSDRNTTNRSSMDGKPSLRRNTSVTQSVRDVMGTMRQKFRKSTRQRKRLQNAGESPITSGSKSKSKGQKRTPTRRGGYREVKMYSPFGIESPRVSRNGIRTRPARWHDVETPSRLRHEVEDLTANMQALVALTPGKLQSRASRSSLRASPLTNGSLSSPARRTPARRARRSLQTTVL